MSKELETVKQNLILEPGEELIWGFKALFFPKSQVVAEIPRLVGMKKQEIQEKRRDIDVKDGMIGLTNKRVFWLEGRGTFRKSYHPLFFVGLRDIISMNMQGTFAKRINIVSSQAEHQFRFGGMENFIQKVLELKSKII